MSLFVDVISPLSDQLKSAFVEIIEREKSSQDRSIRKVCDVCMKFLQYGELRYDKMENGISTVQEKDDPNDPLHVLLLAVLNESLDEDEPAIDYFTLLGKTPLVSSINSELQDFILMGRCITLKQYELIEDTGNIIIQRYSDQQSITDLISNFYLKIDDEAYNPVFQRLMAIAREKYPEHMPLHSLNGFINIKSRNYDAALESFTKILDSLKSDTENKYYPFNMATTLDNIAGCHIKMNDSDKAIEACDNALGFDEKIEAPHKITESILHKKAEALIMKEAYEDANHILHQLLMDNPDDEIALQLKMRMPEINNA